MAHNNQEIEIKLPLSKEKYKEIFQELKKNSHLTTFTEPDLSVVAFRCEGENNEMVNKKTQKLLSLILESGRIHLSSTTINGFLYLRMCVLSFRTHWADIQVALAEIQKASERL